MVIDTDEKIQKTVELVIKRINEEADYKKQQIESAFVESVERAKADAVELIHSSWTNSKSKTKNSHKILIQQEELEKAKTDLGKPESQQNGKCCPMTQQPKASTPLTQLEKVNMDLAKQERQYEQECLQLCKKLPQQPTKCQRLKACDYTNQQEKPGESHNIPLSLSQFEKAKSSCQKQTEQHELLRTGKNQHNCEEAQHSPKTQLVLFSY